MEIKAKSKRLADLKAYLEAEKKRLEQELCRGRSGCRNGRKPCGVWQPHGRRRDLKYSSRE